MALLVAATIGGWLLYQPTQAMTSLDEVSARAVFPLVAQLQASGQSYLPFLSVPTLRAGLYTLAAGASDGQAPHNRDELYYVLEGRSGMTIGSAEYSVAQGDVVFVEAHAEHRFHDIEEPLLLLVFFSEADP